MSKRKVAVCVGDEFVTSWMYLICPHKRSVWYCRILSGVGTDINYSWGLLRLVGSLSCINSIPPQLCNFVGLKKKNKKKKQSLYLGNRCLFLMHCSVLWLCFCSVFVHVNKDYSVCESKRTRVDCNFKKNKTKHTHTHKSRELVVTIRRITSY